MLVSDCVLGVETDVEVLGIDAVCRLSPDTKGRGVSEGERRGMMWSSPPSRGLGRSNDSSSGSLKLIKRQL